ncbi:uncharacterized protein LOC121681986 isoform X1 [Alosa sapidissima]|uniref:uncharacterized protein LOC121681986 isoform X1 n=1 Tax=Alosa sapidissima TaxID=34773 RepID=UPI001C093539|nr:uncharacterized protein LOC121681986 isoform X1 [Alosa sapidissima]
MESFEKLTRRHAVKIASNASVEVCSLAAGEVVGHDNILSAARMNNAIVLFLGTVELANELVERGLVVDGFFTVVLPLSTPSKKVTLSNVPPFIKDEVLAEILSRYGKLVSAIKKIPIGSKSPLLKHVVSFRRSVFMILKDNKDDLDLTLNVKVDNFSYVIYASTSVMKCFGCGQSGHLVRACPKAKGNSSDVQINHENTSRPMPNEIVVDEQSTEMGASTAAIAAPAVSSGPSSASAESVGADHASLLREEVNGVTPIDKPVGREQSSPTDDAVNAESESQSTQNSQSSASAVNYDQVLASLDESLIETEENVFKMPPKRKRSKRTKKSDNLTDLSGTDNEYESDFSDCSVTCSLRHSGFASCDYSVEDIKSFLTKTKHMRNVRIDDYFPDVEQFTTKTKSFLGGCRLLSHYTKYLLSHSLGK